MRELWVLEGVWGLDRFLGLATASELETDAESAEKGAEDAAFRADGGARGCGGGEA